MPQGHVFVVRGRLEAIDAEVVILPTDETFTVEDRWQAVWVGTTLHRPARPEGWRRGSALPSATTPEGPQIWFVDAAQHSGETESEVVAKIVAGVENVVSACDGLRSDRRSLPLVALPTLGVGGGGLGAIRGELIAGLLQGASNAAERCGVDVAIVAYLASDFAAFQHERLRAASFLAPELDLQARRLAERAQRRELALFVGAGVSMSAGLPSWEDLLRKLTTRLESPSDTALLGPLDRAELLSRELADFATAIKEELEPPMRVGLSHLLLVGLGCEEVVTTNFDMLYERAAEIDRTDKLAVLPWDPLDSRRPWLLKMHGDIEHDGSIVLTRGDFIRYESHHGPSGAVLQSLMLSRHLLVVGASLTDDNFLRLAYEVDDFMATSGAPRRKLGTVLSLGPEPLRQRLYDGLFQYVDTSGGGEGNERGRELAIFLDALGMYSSVDSSFLLDPRYEFLPDEDEKSLVGDIAALFARIERRTGSNDEKWRMLGQALRVFGAR